MGADRVAGATSIVLAGVTAELLELREAVWTVRNVPALLPPGSFDDYVRNHPLCGELRYERKGAGLNVRITERGAPMRVDLARSANRLTSRSDPFRRPPD